MLKGCGFGSAIRAKSSTNPAGRGQDLWFQRGDLENKKDIELHVNIYATSRFRTYSKQQFKGRCQQILKRNSKEHPNSANCICQISWNVYLRLIWGSSSHMLKSCGREPVNQTDTHLQHQRTLTRTLRAWVHPGRPWARAPRPRRWACHCDGHILQARRTSPPLCCWWVLSVRSKSREESVD